MFQPLTRVPALHWVMLASGTVTFLLMLAVSLLPVNALPVLAIVISLLPAQLSLIVMVLFLSTEPPSRRAWNAAVYATGIYFAIFIPPALAADRFGYAALPTAYIGAGILAAYALVLGAWQWATGSRLSQAGSPEPANSTPRLPPQYTLIDLMKWVTLISIALGIWSTVTVRFLSAKPLISWTGMYYVYVLPNENLVGGFTFTFGGPAVLLHMTAYWLILSRGPRRTRWLIGLVLALWLLAAFVSLAGLPETATVPLVVLFGPPLFLLPTVLHALVLRRLGWQMISTAKVA